MTPEPITFTLLDPVIVGEKPVITADVFPDYIAVSDWMLAAVAPGAFWLDEQGFLNIRVDNGWATYFRAEHRPTLRQTEFIRVSSHLEPRS